jgi:hypothetical protein
MGFLLIVKNLDRQEKFDFGFGDPNVAHGRREGRYLGR